MSGPRQARTARPSRRGAVSAGTVVALVGLWLAAVGLATAPPGEAAAPCTATPLPTLGGTQGNVVAVSSTGVGVGFAEDGGGTPQPVLWQDGQVRRIDTGLAEATPVGVNSRGEVVGIGVTPGEPSQVGWYWTAGHTSLLQSPPGTIAVPNAISDAGLIVGALASDDDGDAAPTSGEAPEQPASWASSGAAATVLPTLPGDVGGHAYGVNAAGVIVGNSQGTDRFRATVWDGGRVSALSTPASKWSIARSVDEHGVIVGDAATSGGTTEAVTWDPSRAAKAHGHGRGKESQARGLVHGRAVGQTVMRGSDDVDRPHALLWDADTGTSELPPLPGDPGAGVNAASGDSGVVAGFSADDRDVRRPVTWTCGS